MKFARYLQDTQTPEWKKAYIDYRGLKVQLGVIRGQVAQQNDRSSTAGARDLHSRVSAPHIRQGYDESKETRSNQGNTTSARIRSVWAPGSDPAPGQSGAHPIRRRTSSQGKSSLGLALVSLPPRVTATGSTAPSQQTSLPPRTSRSPSVFPPFQDSAGPPTPPPLHAILFNLPAAHTKFFDMLDAELEKVETFYAEREKEMHERAMRLKEQFDELAVHRQMFHRSSAQSKSPFWTKKARLSVPSAFASVMQWLPLPNMKPGNPRQVGASGMLASESGRGGRRGVVDTSNLGTQAKEHVCSSGDHSRSAEREGAEKNDSGRDSGGAPKDNTANTQEDNAKAPPRRSNSLPAGPKHAPDPHEYQHAKRRLRKAAIEHYRGLEVLNNYRILNLTGFRKALKKYEKITKNSVLDAYMKEKVEPSALASDDMVSTLLKEMEYLFADRFERGDRKKALDRLRVGPFSKTHHFSTFRSGLWLGIALPAIAGGSYLSFQEHVRESLPSWNILLFIYSIFLIPLLLSLLIGVNIAVWAREKINYVFIFDLNPRSRLDHHEYFELPSLLLCTLAFAFWLSMAQIGPPTLWPLVWIALTIFIMSNPIRHFMWGNARWWIIKNTGKLGASGVWKVEFTDFWLADQYTSLHYSLANLFFVGCFYTRFVPEFIMSTGPTPVDLASSAFASSIINETASYQLEPSAAGNVFQGLKLSAYDPRVQEAWATCGTVQNWGWLFIIGVLPHLVRFVQSLRRYWDSKLHTHLINAGKYGMAMVYYFFYYHWRHQESPHVGASYILFCFAASIYAIYSCAWDFLMDWSLCKPHAQYPFLRPELIFKAQIPSYYFALISNLCIRFLWLIYPPTGGLNSTLRAFIVSMLEMLRRVQWNFYRLENEHLGNMDQYRVTREVPLPYSFEMPSNEEEEHEEEAGQGVVSESWWKKHLAASRRRNGGHG